MVLESPRLDSACPSVCTIISIDHKDITGASTTPFFLLEERKNADLQNDEQ
jgi:hypothetical protein